MDLINSLNKIKKKVTPDEFRTILKMTEDDIKFNRVGFGKTTTPVEFAIIAQRSYEVISRC